MGIALTSSALQNTWETRYGNSESSDSPTHATSISRETEAVFHNWTHIMVGPKS
jgi:hypothetical protein